MVESDASVDSDEVLRSELKKNSNTLKKLSK